MVALPAMLVFERQVSVVYVGPRGRKPGRPIRG
jgi:hypothetical protein